MSEQFLRGNRWMAVLAVVVCGALLVGMLRQESGFAASPVRPDSTIETPAVPVPVSPSRRSAAEPIGPTDGLTGVPTTDGPTAPTVAEPPTTEVTTTAVPAPPFDPGATPTPTVIYAPSTPSSYTAISSGPFELDAPPESGPGRPIWPSAGAQARPETSSVDVYDQPNGQVVVSLDNPFGPQRSHPAFGIRAKRGDWLHVDLPTRPNGSQGWIRARDVNIFWTDVSIDVDLANNMMTVYEKDDIVKTVAVSTGADHTPTPTGVFFVSDLLPNPGGTYGSYAFGLSGHSDVLTNFVGGDGQIAIHGTDRPDQMGLPASHGCVRVTNDLATELSRSLTIGVRVRVHDGLGDRPPGR